MSAAGNHHPEFIVSTGAGRVLVADDDRFYRTMLEEKLQAAGHEVVSTPDGASAWSLVQEEPFDMVIADWMMPVMDGFQLCRRIKEVDRLHHVFCALMTTKDRVRSALTALEEGAADDYVVKPCDDSDLLARVRCGLRVSRLHRRLEEVGRRDALTGLIHPGSFGERMFEEVARANRYGGPLSLVLVELDELAAINNNFGHLVGDEVLAAVGQRLLVRVRSGEVALRIAGDQFAVLMPSTRTEGANVFCRDIEQQLSQVALPRSDVFPYRVTAISACAELAEGASDADLLLAARSALSDRRVERKEQWSDYATGCSLSAEPQAPVE